MPRTIAFGDVHGAYYALERLLDVILPTPEDTIIGLGDYVDRGPQSCQVIDRLIQLKNECNLILLMGNHEIMMFSGLSAEKTGRPQDRENWLFYGGDTFLSSYESQSKMYYHLKFLVDNIKPYHETDSHIFVHAGYDPVLPMAEQSDWDLYWEHMLDPKPHSSGKVAVIGHTPRPRPIDLGFLKRIDTDAWVSGTLTAYDATSNTFYQG